MPRVYITCILPDSITNKLKDAGIDYEMWDGDENISRDLFIEKVKQCSGIVCYPWNKIDEQVVKSAGENLRVISTVSVGYDHVDLACLKRYSIKLGFTPDVLTDSTAELTVGLLLATSRNIILGNKTVKNGTWQVGKPFWMCGWGLNNSTVGIVGMGRIGRAVAKRIIPFGVKEILYYNRSGQTGDTMNISDSSFNNIPPAYWRSLEDLLKQSDYVIVCCSSNADSKHLFNKKTFNLMKSSGIFINTSRGSVVNQDDLYDALTSGVIRAAGLDVTDPEPLPPSHKLLTLDNCVILPHIGSADFEAREGMINLAIDNVIAGVFGKPLKAEMVHF